MKLSKKDKKRFIGNVQEIYEDGGYVFEYDGLNDMVTWYIKGEEDSHTFLPFERFLISWQTDFINDIRSYEIGDLLFNYIGKKETIEIMAFLLSDIRL